MTLKSLLFLYWLYDSYFTILVIHYGVYVSIGTAQNTPVKSSVELYTQRDESRNCIGDFVYSLVYGQGVGKLPRYSKEFDTRDTSPAFLLGESMTFHDGSYLLLKYLFSIIASTITLMDITDKQIKYGLI